MLTTSVSVCERTFEALESWRGNVYDSGRAIKDAVKSIGGEEVRDHGELDLCPVWLYRLGSPDLFGLSYIPDHSLDLASALESFNEHAESDVAGDTEHLSNKYYGWIAWTRTEFWRGTIFKSKCKPLLDLQAQFPGRLNMFEADLVKAGSFAEAMQGCQAWKCTNFRAAGLALHMLETMYRGENRMGVADLSYPIVDVQEVAGAHSKVFEESESAMFQALSGNLSRFAFDEQLPPITAGDILWEYNL
ncbi:hypothetical protein HJFPF1_04586 [Paramyrothecium foliicola]|nr:hypothetical protein HJFPF1_04586 [Paramyrothecium foliicola]